MDELREQIWDYLFHAGAERGIDEIAASTGKEPSVVRSATAHPWFRVAGDRVGVAYATGPISSLAGNHRRTPS